MTASYIISACRTPIGKLMGVLAPLTAPELGAIVVREVLYRDQIDAGDVDEAILGCVLTAGVGQAPARQAALKAGLPDSIAALTINKVCGSGLKAVMLADQAIRAGDARLVIAGGMESMSGAPHLLVGSRVGWKLGNGQLVDSMIHDGLWCSIENVPMGVLADATAERYQISREDQDAFALESHRRAAAAASAMAGQLVPVTVSGKRSQLVVTGDEGPRADVTLDSLARLPPAFGRPAPPERSSSSSASVPPSVRAGKARRTGAGSQATVAGDDVEQRVPAHTVTAGNASQISDGAAALVVASAKVAESYDSPLKARIVAAATAGVAPRELLMSPVAAIRKVLSLSGLSLDQIDLVELNEAFAAQCLACMKALELDHAKLNVCGGAIALGHPIGASGARLLVTLLHELARRDLRRGLAALCLGGGNAVAMIVERD